MFDDTIAIGRALQEKAYAYGLNPTSSPGEPRYEFTAWVEGGEQTKHSRLTIVSGMNYGNTADVLNRFIGEGLTMSPGSKMKIEVVRLVDKE